MSLPPDNKVDEGGKNPPQQSERCKIAMKLPKQSPPVKRPHFITTHKCVDVFHGRGEYLVQIRMDLMHGANYNDPAQFQYPAYGYLKMSSHRLLV